MLLAAPHAAAAQAGRLLSLVRSSSSTEFRDRVAQTRRRQAKLLLTVAVKVAVLGNLEALQQQQLTMAAALMLWSKG